MKNFVGRQHEIEKIIKISQLGIASFVVMSGRRRIGKSRLVAQFAESYTFYKFSGLAPRSGMTAQDQRDEFMRLFSEQFQIPLSDISDWGTLFSLLARQCQAGRVVILLDEISWMAQGDPDFLGKLKTTWDDQFKANPELMLFLCGSVSTWIEDNLLSSTAFLGRPSLHIRLQELPLNDCNEFWCGNHHISACEKLKLLAVTGGVPRYLELIDPNLTAEQNIQQLFFEKESILYNEFLYIFNDIYGKRSNIYRAIVDVLVAGPATQEEVANQLKLARSGDLGLYLRDLILGGFVQRDFNWQMKTGKLSNLSKYRLSDNYLRFALKYILPNQPLIDKGRFEDRPIQSLPGWDSIMGLQFENLVLNNSRLLLKRLKINSADIIYDNPYFQKPTARLKGCQIDYLIQTRHDNVYVCEIRFHRKAIGLSVIDDVRQKLDRLKVPKYISKRAVLIHANGVSEEVVDSRFFSEIIGFDQLLQ